MDPALEHRRMRDVDVPEPADITAFQRDPDYPQWRIVRRRLATLLSTTRTIRRRPGWT